MVPPGISNWAEDSRSLLLTSPGGWAGQEEVSLRNSTMKIRKFPTCRAGGYGWGQESGCVNEIGCACGGFSGRSRVPRHMDCSQAFHGCSDGSQMHPLTPNGKSRGTAKRGSVEGWPEEPALNGGAYAEASHRKSRKGNAGRPYGREILAKVGSSGPAPDNSSGRAGGRFFGFDRRGPDGFPPLSPRTGEGGNCPLGSVVLKSLMKIADHLKVEW